MYDYREKNNLYYILPNDCRVGVEKSRDNIRQAALLVNLYYLDDCKKYLDKLSHLSLDIYIFSSKDEICDMATAYNKKNFFVYKKENRGRDLSALLVTAKPFIYKYELLGFIHDKKPKKDTPVYDDIILWTMNLWENIVCSEEYIFNVVDVFNNNPKIGLLLPPELWETKRVCGRSNYWCEAFDATQSVIDMFGLNYKLSREDSAIGMGSAFWCRRDALKKLCNYEWKYEDFPEEPMPDDGTISHGIERSLPYFAHSEGYLTGTIMSTTYASIYIAKMWNAFNNYARYMDIQNNMDVAKCELYNWHIEQVIIFKQQHSKLFLYGAGKMGQLALAKLQAIGIRPDGFIVSKKENNMSEIAGVKVFSIEEIDMYDKIGIYITVSDRYKTEIRNMLDEYRNIEYKDFDWTI